MNPYLIPGLINPSISWQVHHIAGDRPKSFKELLSVTVSFFKHHPEFIESARGAKPAQDVKSVLSKSQQREYVVPRQLFCYAAKIIFPKATLMKIAKFLDLADHSTVIHSVKVIEDWKDTEKYFKKKLNIFREGIGLKQLAL